MRNDRNNPDLVNAIAYYLDRSPYKIYGMLSDEEKSNIKILDKTFFYYPSYYEVDKIFEHEILIDKNLLTLHLWNSYSEKYYKNINNFLLHNTKYLIVIKSLKIICVIAKNFPAKKDKKFVLFYKNVKNKDFVTGKFRRVQMFL
jgi:hypothetical protein